jgi:hypothetical protein
VKVFFNTSTAATRLLGLAKNLRKHAHFRNVFLDKRHSKVFAFAFGRMMAVLESKQVSKWNPVRTYEGVDFGNNQQVSTIDFLKSKLHIHGEVVYVDEVVFDRKPTATPKTSVEQPRRLHRPYHQQRPQQPIQHVQTTSSNEFGDNNNHQQQPQQFARYNDQQQQQQQQGQQVVQYSNQQPQQHQGQIPGISSESVANLGVVRQQSRPVGYDNNPLSQSRASPQGSISVYRGRPNVNNSYQPYQR